LLDDALDERLARDERERFAGKPRRSKPRGDDANDFHAAILATDETWMKHRISRHEFDELARMKINWISFV
jgi:hypothetical protein